jgi:hypothetical protein
MRRELYICVCVVILCVCVCVCVVILCVCVVLVVGDDLRVDLSIPLKTSVFGGQVGAIAGRLYMTS